MFARLPAHRDKLERDGVDVVRIDRCKIISKTKILSAPLFERLPRERESKSLRLLVILIDDQIVPARLTREVAVDKFCLEKFFADRLCLYLGKLRIDGFV